MKKLFFVVAFLSMVLTGALAQSLSISQVEIKAGETKEMFINLSNSNLIGIVFNVELPTGFSLRMSGSEVDALGGSTLTDYHSYSATQVSGQVYNFSVYTGTDNYFNSNGNFLFKVYLEAASDVDGGDVIGYIKDIVATLRGGSTYSLGNSTFTISVPVELTITADDKSREYGDDNPALTYTLEGGTLPAGEVPELTTTARANSVVGDYPITVGKGTVTKKYKAVNGKLTVNKALLTITGETYTIKQGERLPTFAATYSGFKNNETEAVLTRRPTLSLPRGVTSASEPGEYVIEVAGAEARNYDITQVDGKLIIESADLITVTAKSYTIKYGDRIPTFGYDVAGGTLSGRPTLSCEATSTSPVGEYDIVIQKGSIGNYNVQLVAGKLTIEKASLTITAGSYTQYQGWFMPDISKVTYSGFKNGENENVLTTKPTVTTTRTVASEPGTYPVVASGAEAENYSMTYVDGVFTVKEAPAITIKANNATRYYGDENPNFTYTSTGATLNGVPSMVCEATPTSPVGTYPIVISKGSVENYNETYVDGTLTIVKAPLKATAKSYTKLVGEANPDPLEVEYEGFKNNETESVLTTLPVVTTTCTTESTVGTYPITVSGGDAENYVLSYVSGVLTVQAVTTGIDRYQDGEEGIWYDMMGHKLDAVPHKKGVYIRNGKKVIIY